MKGIIRSKRILTLCTLVATIALVVPLAMFVVSPRHTAQAAPLTFAPKGNLDCNGHSKIQQLIRTHMMCKDFAGYDGGRGYDNGHYVGHDEPTVNFFSNAPGSGSNVQWKITLPKEHPLPATQSFQNYITYWFGMVLCDPNSYPQQACTPDSDKNHAPRFVGDTNTSGSAFLELQFYPPGFSPFISRVSCDLKHWCAALNIDSLECTPGFATCNPNCTEPVNFAFLQMDGVPTGPPGPANSNDATVTPNKQTLRMDQGDTLKVTVQDTRDGLLTRVKDVTTEQSGFMVASAHNGFQSLNVNTCAPTNFNFHPEYNTAKFGNFLNWGLGQGNIGFDVEIGHFENGANGDADTDDAPCFPGPTVPGCLDFAQGGDIDFDGTSYQPDWADGTRNTPMPLELGSVLGSSIGPVSSPLSQNDYTHAYPARQFDTEVLASESTCMADGSGCSVPPPGATFYPFFAQSGRGSPCTLTFGNDIRGQTVNDFGRDLQYGVPNTQWSPFDSSGGIRPNVCTQHA